MKLAIFLLLIFSLVANYGFMSVIKKRDEKIESLNNYSTKLEKFWSAQLNKCMGER
jgi:Tfp pilus assembly protein PilO